MNNAVISIGMRNPGLRKAALAAATRIGPVKVDHVETECRTPRHRSRARRPMARPAPTGRTTVLQEGAESYQMMEKTAWRSMDIDTSSEWKSRGRSEERRPLGLP